MYRLAVISIDSGQCIANPIYKTFDDAKAELDGFIQSKKSSVYQYLYRMDSECGKNFFIPLKSNLSFVIEPALDE